MNRLCQRIFRAEQLGKRRKVKKLQRLMLRSKANLLLLIKRVTQVNKGKRTAGVDGYKVISERDRVILFNIMKNYDIKHNNPKPVRRTYIPKKNGKLRLLGIPIIKDRVFQNIARNALEPQWESKFESINIEKHINGGYKMKFIGNEEYWDNKFVKRSDNPLSPERFMIENIKYFKKGSVLDIACGDGRNALFLLENGFDVTGIDFSSKALERLRMFAKRSNYLVNTKQIDLNIPNCLNDMGVFDNILINHYRLSKKQLEEIEKHITEDGILFICSFGYRHKVDSKIRKEDLIQATDFEDIRKSFDLIRYSENQDSRGFFVTYIFSKKS